MNKSTIRVMMSFALIILIIATVMFYLLAPSDAGFVPTCMSMVFAGAVFILCLLAYDKQAAIEGKKVPVKMAVIVFLIVIALIIVLKLIVS